MTAGIVLDRLEVLMENYTFEKMLKAYKDLKAAQWTLEVRRAEVAIEGLKDDEHIMIGEETLLAHANNCYEQLMVCAPKQDLRRLAFVIVELSRKSHEGAAQIADSVGSRNSGLFKMSVQDLTKSLLEKQEQTRKKLGES